MKQNNIQIPEGYINSSLGIIPQDWEVKKLGEVCIRIGDGIHGTPEYTNFSDYYFINGNNLVNGKIQINQDTKNISENEYKTQKIKLDTNTILISINGTIGNIATYNGEQIMLGKSAAYLIFKKSINYFYQLLRHESIKNYWKSELSGSTIKNLSLKSIRETPFPLPPLSQQQKIAEILGTWDEAIEKQSTLIDKLTERKRGLMQQLLTGKKRITGFNEEWKEVRLGDIGETVTGNTPDMTRSEYYGGEYNWVTAVDIKQMYVKDTKIKLSELGISVARMVPKGSILVTCIASIGKNAISDVDLAFNQQINAIIPNKNYIAEFIYYQIENSANLLKSFAGLGAVPIINKTTFNNIKIRVPSLPEQTAIANILTAADKEIELAKCKLELLRSQKSGLMQQLLTGKTRVKID